MKATQFNRLKILVIDDDLKRKQPFRDLLETQGFMVIWCQNWTQVEQRFFSGDPQEEPFPDIVLVDMNFYPPHTVLGENPAMEGVLIIKKFSETCERHGVVPPPLIGFTGHEDYMQKQEMILAGVNDFISAEEFKNREILGTRLLECIQEAHTTQMLKPPSHQEIYIIEEHIVQRALALHKNDLREAADFLNWSFDEVTTIQQRLLAKGDEHVV